MYKLNRNSFKIQTIKESDNTKEYWLNKTPNERFSAAWYLICSAYNLNYYNPPKMDKTIFSIRKDG